MALVGSYGSGATINSRWTVYCGARSKTRPGPKDARVDRRRDASADKVGIKMIRGVARSSPKATVGSGRQDRKGIGTDPGKMLGKVVLCPSLRSHQQAKGCKRRKVN